MPDVTGPKAKKWLRSERYINREYSWLQFNRRVLEEAANPATPLLERLRFLAIFESNLDEFYMVRVSGLIEQVESGVKDLSLDGLAPLEQIQLISSTATKLRRKADELWNAELRPALGQQQIYLRKYEELSELAKTRLQAYFTSEVFPVCTPLILHPATSVPFISNRSINLAVRLLDESGNEKIARVKVPDVLPRLVRVGKKANEFVLLEDLIRANLGNLFPGITIGGAYTFRVLRDADFEIRELEAGDLIEKIEQTLKLRRFGDPVLLECEDAMPAETCATLARLLELSNTDIIRSTGLVGYSLLHEFAKLERRDLKYPDHVPQVSDTLTKTESLFSQIAHRDVLVHHPFDSFLPVEEFVDSAADDPAVIGIKQTLYRVGSESPIVESLLAAAELGKQVAVTVELKARFDESNNLVWARALERAGAHVTFGIEDMKTHVKLCLIVRREGSGIRTYAHIGTGNYNPVTARLYTDLGLFTVDAEITQDILELFNYLTGFSKQTDYRKLLVAPLDLRAEVLSRIKREAKIAAKSGSGRIIFKLNSLVDPEVIDALYDASKAGVKVDLLIRGICCLRPGIEGLSTNIRVRSIVGRFLEHSRILYFGNGGQEEALIGSADLMPRNLDRRVEVLCPITDRRNVDYLLNVVLQSYLKDTTNAWEMRSDGSYERKGEGKEPFAAQKYLVSHPACSMLQEES